MTDPKSRLHLLDDPDFKELTASKTRISIILTTATLIIYYGFIFLVAFKKEFFGRKFTENIPIGIPIGVGVIVASWVLTGIYVRWANARYDTLVQNVKDKVEAHDAGRP
ncbi:MAG TPA: DUF485 domain-containing protein [Planctomycetota bacterium]|nr:DUF485 domain-containing protein [Planctomycetota bacterium]